MTMLNNDKNIVKIPLNDTGLEGNLVIPKGAGRLVIFAHGSGSSRHSPRNKFVANGLRQYSLATLLIDLLTIDEEAIDMISAEYRFNIQLLADRLVKATDWARSNPRTKDMKIGYFGASTGAAAALIAATRRQRLVSAIVSRGGRPDLAQEVLMKVRAPTLLIVGGHDEMVISLNRKAFNNITAEKSLRIVPGATHLFEEPGALAEVTRLAGQWLSNK